MKVKDIVDKVYEARIRISTYDEENTKWFFIYDEDVKDFGWNTEKISEETLDKEVTEIYVYDSSIEDEYKVIELVTI